MSDDKRTREELKLMQALPMDIKIAKTEQRIREFVRQFGEDGVAVSFSGGADSTVLLDIVRKMYPNVEAVFANTGLEYPEIQSFARSKGATFVTPKMKFYDVIREYGYPIISKEVANTLHLAQKNKKQKVYTIRLAKLGITRNYAENNGYTMPSKEKLRKYEKSLKNSMHDMSKYQPLLDVDFMAGEACCYKLKKAPMTGYLNKSGKYPLIATMAEESMLRAQSWLKNGCNIFDGHISSRPMSFWIKQDTLRYIKERNLEVCSVYGNVVYADGSDQCRYWNENEPLKFSGCQRTGCIFCCFGAHCRGDRRLLDLKITHPKQYEYMMDGGAYDTDGLWKPDKRGLGFAHVLDTLNDIYGKDFIRY